MSRKEGRYREREEGIEGGSEVSRKEGRYREREEGIEGRRGSCRGRKEGE